MLNVHQKTWPGRRPGEQWCHHGKVANRAFFPVPRREIHLSQRLALGGGKGCSILLLNSYLNGVEF